MARENYKTSNRGTLTGSLSFLISLNFCSSVVFAHGGGSVAVFSFLIMRLKSRRLYAFPGAGLTACC
jgi:hypothetical protein